MTAASKAAQTARRDLTEAEKALVRFLVRESIRKRREHQQATIEKVAA